MKHLSILSVLALLCLCLSPNQLQSQFDAGLSQEIGVVAGPIAFLTDYGMRNDFSTNIGNTGTGIGLVYYINFAHTGHCYCVRKKKSFTDHFRVRAELDYHTTSLKHYGNISRKKTAEGELLRAMIGSSRVYELGAHFEYFPQSIGDFADSNYLLAPFVSLGANYVRFDPDAYSTLGNLREHLHPSFVDGIDLKSGKTWSIVFGGGMRYKLNASSDLVANMQWRYYKSDWLDGLDHKQPQNKFNDMTFWLNAGYIYYLKF